MKTNQIKRYLVAKPLFAMLFVLAFTFMSCDNDDNNESQAPLVISTTTDENVAITYTSIKIDGEVTSDQGSTVIARGVCWSTNSNPTINDSKTTETSNIYSSTINNLIANTNYHFRVYATNSAGTSYGLNQNFSTSTLNASTWNFLLTNSGQTWNADVTFNTDGTTVYDEPSSPGTYTTYGTWSLNGNTLTYDMDSSENTNTSYQFTGTLLNNTMTGTYNFGSYPDQIFSAVEY
ncbi:fibronectin type III domain-containing protein [Flavobacterium ardleyense]|uniref:Fibronectin type III domain-containing protein n=1 Tax=Flavobacterium ardleyense TaxID=2038737 RepID=A0ABW5Z9M8_9FLAO